MKFTYDVNDEKVEEKNKGRCSMPKRYVFVLLGFFGFLNIYATRVCLGVTMVAMVNSSVITNTHNNEVFSDCFDIPHRNESEVVTKLSTGEKYNWDANTQGLILGALYYGVLLSLLPGAVLCQKFGAKWFFGGPVFVSAILTLLTPIAASSGAVPLFIIRLLQGLAEGITFPAINAMIAKWSHILERSRFVSLIYIGIHMGNIVSPMVSGWLCSTDVLGGWPLPFYVFGITGSIWFIFWSIFIYETPGVHRSISAKELQYLEGSKEISEKVVSTISICSLRTHGTPRQKVVTPWRVIFTSAPVWTAVIASTSNDFAFLIFMMEIPTYFSTALHFGVVNVGILTAVGFAVKAIFSWFASYSADLLRRWDRLSITNIRKLFTAVALFGPAVCLLGVTLSGCYFELIAGLVILSTALSGFFYAGVGTVHIDLSPTFAGAVLALIDVFGNITGIVGPSIVGAITLKTTTVAQWNYVFYIAVALLVFAGLIYTAFGSAELQPWDKGNTDSSSGVKKSKQNFSEGGVISKIQDFSSFPTESTTIAKTNGKMHCKTVNESEIVC